jgi:DNA-binding MarR family transcriptional regulator
MNEQAVLSDSSSLARRLHLLGNQMLNLASEVSQRGGDGHEVRRAVAELARDSGFWGVLAEELYRDRRRRASHLPSHLLGEPAWDILLDLYIAEKRNQSVSVTSACIAAAVPLTTALRWLRQLERDGLVERRDDQSDARRRYVRLTESGYERMTAFFADTHSDVLVDDVLRRRPRSERALWTDACQCPAEQA